MIELYYPGIKVREDNWLKYSLLTKRELYTIKPMQYANLDYGYLNDRLGQEFLKPYNPTNLIKRYDSSGASFEKIILNHMIVINSQKTHFKIATPQNTYLDDELRTAEKNSILFKGKYTPDIEDFVLDYGYGEKFGGNLKVSNRFAIIYMGILAEHISYLDKKVSIVSKHSDAINYQDNLNILSQGPLALRRSNYSDAEETYNRRILEIMLPRNINEITIEQIAKVRSEQYIRELGNLNSLMETLFENEFDFLDRNDLFKEIFDINNVLSGIIKSKLGRTTIMIGVGYFLSLYKPAFLMSEALESIASSTIDIYASRHIPIRIREGNSAMRIITSLNDI